MNKLIGFLLVFGLFLLCSVSVEAASFRITNQPDAVDLICTVGQLDCQWSGVLIYANDTIYPPRPLFNSTFYTSDPTHVMQYTGFDGVMTSGQSTTSIVYQPGEGPNIFVRVVAPTNQIRVMYPTLYIDGRVCNQTNPPQDCTFYGGKGFTVRVQIVAASPNPSPSVLPSPSVDPSPNPSPTADPSSDPSPTPIPTPTPQPTVEPSVVPSATPSTDASPSPSPETKTLVEFKNDLISNLKSWMGFAQSDPENASPEAKIVELETAIATRPQNEQNLFAGFMVMVRKWITLFFASL